MTTQAQKHLKLLGVPCRDKVTGLEGVITSISFDLYGCIQAVVHPGLDDKGALRDSNWFDIARLEVTGVPIMEQPNFVKGAVAEGKKGAAEKPNFGKS